MYINLLFSNQLLYLITYIYLLSLSNTEILQEIIVNYSRLLFATFNDGLKTFITEFKYILLFL